MLKECPRVSCKEMLTYSHLRVKCTCMCTCTDTKFSHQHMFPYFLVILFPRDRDTQSLTSAWLGNDCVWLLWRLWCGHIHNWDQQLLSSRRLMSMGSISAVESNNRLAISRVIVWARLWLFYFTNLLTARKQQKWLLCCIQLQVALIINTVFWQYVWAKPNDLGPVYVSTYSSFDKFSFGKNLQLLVHWRSLKL